MPRRTPRSQRRSFPPPQGWRAWFGRLQQWSFRRRRERSSRTASALAQRERLEAHHQRFLAAWSTVEIGNLRRELAHLRAPDRARRLAVRLLALEGPQSDGWVALARAQLEGGQVSAGLWAAAEAVRVGLLPAEELAAMAAGTSHAETLSRVFSAAQLPPAELGKLFQSLRGWPGHRVLRHVLLTALFSRVQDEEERSRLTELTATLPDDGSAELEHAVAEAWVQMAGRPAPADFDTVPPATVWLHDAPYDWAPVLRSRLPQPAESETTSPVGVRVAARPGAFDCDTDWPRRRCRAYLLGQGGPAALASPPTRYLQRLHSEDWRLVGLECVAEAWSPASAPTWRQGLSDLLAAARRFGEPVRRARALYHVSALMQLDEPAGAWRLWDEAAELLASLPGRSVPPALPAAVAAILRVAGAGHEAAGRRELDRLLELLDAADSEAVVAAILGTIPAPESAVRTTALERLAALPAADHPAAGYLLAWERRDLAAQVAPLRAGWGQPAAAPWPALAIATARAATTADELLLAELAAAAEGWYKAGDPLACGPWLVSRVRAEQLGGRPAAPGALALLPELAGLRGPALDHALVALAACADGAAPGWWRAVEEAFLRRLSRPGPAGPLSPSQLDLLIEILAHSQITARVGAWLAAYDDAVAAWRG